MAMSLKLYVTKQHEKARKTTVFGACLVTKVITNKNGKNSEPI